MGFYSNCLFPFALDWVLSKPPFMKLREKTLLPAQGKILEIGIGTGLNLLCYPNTVKQIVAIDPNPGMRKKILAHANEKGIQVDFHLAAGEALPFPNQSFDTVVSTWTLCSVQRVEGLLKEIQRVLKPNGRFLFLEHGLSPDPSLQKWQKRLTPLNAALTEGCHLDRDVLGLLKSSGLTIQTHESFRSHHLPKPHDWMTLGTATRSE